MGNLQQPRREAKETRVLCQDTARGIFPSEIELMGWETGNEREGGGREARERKSRC